LPFSFLYLSEYSGIVFGAYAMGDPLLIGIDVGTTSVKGALLDRRGHTQRSCSATYPTMRNAERVEQNPADWMQHVLRALTELTEGLGPSDLASIGLCSQVNTHVFVDGNGEPLLPAFVWQDGRCAMQAEQLTAMVSESDRMKWWGAPLPIDSSHVLSRMAWVKTHHPEIWAKTRWVMAPKDYCIFKLTGEVLADPMTSFGIVDGTLAYIPELLALVPGAEGRLPPLAPFTTSCGRIKSGLPAAGTRMVVGTMDAWASVLGSGVSQQGEGVYLSGTSEVVGIVSRHKVPTAGVIAFPECTGIVLHAGPTQAGGASIEWVSQLLGRTPENLSQLVSKADHNAATPIFLPHLQGERAPLWDIAARASFSGIDASMGPAEFARSVFEGVAYSVRLLLGSLEQSADCKVSALRLSGGGASSDIWCQIRADILGRPLHRVTNLNSGLVGAAMLAGIGVGVYHSIAEASKELVSVAKVFEPNIASQQKYDLGFKKFLELYAALKPFNRM
jgi:xylulokinase